MALTIKDISKKSPSLKEITDYKENAEASKYTGNAASSLTDETPHTRIVNNYYNYGPGPQIGTNNGEIVIPTESLADSNYKSGPTEAPNNNVSSETI